MTKDELKQMQKNYRDKYGSAITHWLGTIILNWEKKLLMDIQAITEQGVLADYPMLEVISSTGPKIIDYGGNVSAIQNAANAINNDQKDKTKAQLEYYPKVYSEYLELNKQIIEDEDAIQAIKRQQRLMQDKQAKLM